MNGNGFAFEATRQPDGSYIMIVSGTQYRCTDWDDVCKTYNRHMEGEDNAKTEGSINQARNV